MNREEIITAFENHDDDYGSFDEIKGKLSTRPDIHAFILLNLMVPGKTDMITSSRDDEIYLDVDVDELVEENATENQIIDLIRCGVILEDEEYLMMMV